MQQHLKTANNKQTLNGNTEYKKQLRKYQISKVMAYVQFWQNFKIQKVTSLNPLHIWYIEQFQHATFENFFNTSYSCQYSILENVFHWLCVTTF